MLHLASACLLHLSAPGFSAFLSALLLLEVPAVIMNRYTLFVQVNFYIGIDNAHLVFGSHLFEVETLLAIQAPHFISDQAAVAALIPHNHNQAFTKSRSILSTSL